jgi:non-canonical purine NTP pyrophosphatase (RdgB/HAM1 family)
MIYLITGNKDKFAEFKSIIRITEIKRLDIDIPEIQDVDPQKIIQAKLVEGLKHLHSNVAVEDTSFHLECMNGLPGPLVKWFLKSVGPEGIYRIAEGLGNFSAEARCTIGYAPMKDSMHFFEGRVKGKVVPPRGSNGFGWDVIFVPEGHSRTYAEMDPNEKNAISHRRLAIDKLSEFLAGHDKAR